MREILFRGKRLDNGEWVYWTGLGRFTVTQCGRLISGKEGLTDWAYELLTVPATVGQYTGLTDKNGKKIFEGDIWDCNGCIGVIKWVEEVCSFEANYVMHGIEYANAVSDYRAAKVEVIGNIHDNPELLGGDES